MVVKPKPETLPYEILMEYLKGYSILFRDIQSWDDLATANWENQSYEIQVAVVSSDSTIWLERHHRLPYYAGLSTTLEIPLADPDSMEKTQFWLEKYLGEELNE